jgi:hypothetical protein
MKQSLSRPPETHRRAADGVMCLATQLGAGVSKAQRAAACLVGVAGASLDEPRRPQRDQAGDHRVLAAQRLGQGDGALQLLLELRRGIAIPGIERRRNSFEDSQLLAITVAASGQVTDDRQGFPVQPDCLLVGVPVLGPSPRGGQVGNRQRRAALRE